MNDIKKRLEKIEKIRKEPDRPITFIIPQGYNVPFDKLESCSEYQKRKKGKSIYLPCHKCNVVCNLPSDERVSDELLLNRWHVLYQEDTRKIIIMPVKGEGWE